MSSIIIQPDKSISLRSVLAAVEDWYARASTSEHQQALTLKVYSQGRGVINQVDVTPSETFKGKVVNDLPEF